MFRQAIERSRQAPDSRSNLALVDGGKAHHQAVDGRRRVHVPREGDHAHRVLGRRFRHDGARNPDQQPAEHLQTRFASRQIQRSLQALFGGVRQHRATRGVDPAHPADMAEEMPVGDEVAQGRLIHERTMLSHDAHEGRQRVDQRGGHDEVAEAERREQQLVEAAREDDTAVGVQAL